MYTSWNVCYSNIAGAMRKKNVQIVYSFQEVDAFRARVLYRPPTLLSLKRDPILEKSGSDSSNSLQFYHEKYVSTFHGDHCILYPVYERDK